MDVNEGEAQGTDKRVRPDAQRSLDALVKAARAVFATSGVDAPVRDIADRAGVGIGTFYRHFPQRADLVTAVYRLEIDACADAAPAFLIVDHPDGFPATIELGGERAERDENERSIGWR